jgi:molybdate transport system substrate-binding protein
MVIVHPPKETPTWQCVAYVDDPVLLVQSEDARRRHAERAHEFLRGSSVARLAMGDPAHVPAGRYGRAALERLGLWDEVAPRVLPCESVRAALALVERGEADAGIVFATDASASARVEVLRDLYKAPVSLPAPAIRYPCLALRGAPVPALRFLEALGAPGARRSFEDFGFLLPGKTE